jgi:hypothetical protein
MLFVRPIYKILVGGAGLAAVERSAGYQSMRQSIWLSLSGAVLMLLSSIAVHSNSLYFVYGLYVGPGHPALSNPYLNIDVFGIIVSSICNDVGMLLVCGVWKKLKVKVWVSRIWNSRGLVVVEPTANVVPVFESRACNECDHDV